MSGFNPLAFANDIAKGVGDVAGNAARIAASAIDGAIKAAVPSDDEQNGKRIEEHCEEPHPIPDPQYRDGEIDAFWVDKKYVEVRQITVGSDGSPMEGYKHYLRLSRHGVERVQSTDMFAKPMERIRIRNCTLFKNGEEAGEDALKKGAFFGSVATLFAFHPLAVGFLAAMTARGKRDLWALDILDYDGKEWLFTVSSKEEGEELLKYLDRYFMI